LHWDDRNVDVTTRGNAQHGRRISAEDNGIATEWKKTSWLTCFEKDQRWRQWPSDLPSVQYDEKRLIQQEKKTRQSAAENKNDLQKALRGNVDVIVNRWLAGTACRAVAATMAETIHFN
jgi:hypothetical protein